MMEIQNYIDGRWSNPVSKTTLEVYEPATGSVYAKIPRSSAQDVNLAVAAASRAFEAWSKTPASERSRLLRKIAAGIDARHEELARAESIDTGKPLTLARSLDIPRAAQNFAFFADAITQTTNESYAMDQAAINYTLRDPLGVVACISPWNLPLYLLSWKIAPALASGCTVVAKPSEVTPMTAHLLTQICAEAGLPPGVLNIIHGTGAEAGAALVAHHRVRAVSFTGSTKTGAEIARICAPSFKKVSLEMGGKNANLIFADCDFEEAAQGAARAAFTNQGQICLCGSRILIERSIYDRFKTTLIERVRGLKLGDPLTEGTDQGAVVSREHFDKVMGAIEMARDDGGKILVGGKAQKPVGRCQSGWFIEPTLIEGLPASAQANQEEIFGPVATLIPFNSEDEAVALANCTRYGLSATIWTESTARAHRVAAQLEAGVIWINCWMVRDLRTPFGGMKDSGLGREGGQEALRFFSESKNVCVKVGK
jgi:aminomuconate-semialdehyde/2-hydroxymuconate-6-semialdehyde dehydrogenase